MYSTLMRDRHSGPKDKEPIKRRRKGEQENVSHRQQDCTRKHPRGAHEGRSNGFKIAHRRLKPAEANQMLGSVGCQRTW